MCHCGFLFNTWYICLVLHDQQLCCYTVLLVVRVWQRHGLLGQQPSCSLHALMNTRLGLYFSNTAVISSTATGSRVSVTGWRTQLQALNYSSWFFFFFLFFFMLNKEQ